MKYMVMECHPGYAVVLSDDGRFLKVANMRYETGQTVTDVVELSLPQLQEESGKKRNRRWMSSLAAVAACLVLVITSVFFTNQMTYASVYMAINPEVRIDVNRNDMVVGVEGVNADGADLLEGYEYREKDLDLVMDELVDRAIDMGYLHEGGQIALTLDADDNEWVVTHGDTLTDQLNKHLTEKLTITVEIIAQSARDDQVFFPSDDGESDYGESDYGDAAPSAQLPAVPVPDDSNANDGEDGTNYDGQADDDEDDEAGQTTYDAAARSADVADDDGQTDYGTLEQKDGSSNYEADDDDEDPDDDEDDE